MISPSSCEGGGDLPALGPRGICLDDQRVVADHGEVPGAARCRRRGHRGAASSALPCICTWARTMRPPSAAPMAWWPRQTPRMGSLPMKARIASTQMPALGRRAGARREHQVVGASAPRCPPRDLVVAEDAHVLAQFAEVLHQVEGERIVVVDHQQHGRSSGQPAHRRRRWHRSWSAFQHLERAAEPGGTNSASRWGWPPRTSRRPRRGSGPAALVKSSCSAGPKAMRQWPGSGHARRCRACHAPAARRRSRFRVGLRAASVRFRESSSGAPAHHGAELEQSGAHQASSTSSAARIRARAFARSPSIPSRAPSRPPRRPPPARTACWS